MEKLELKTLTLKLIAFDSAQIGQSLHIIDVAYMKEANDDFEFLLSEHIKQSSPGFKAPSVILKAYSSSEYLLL